MERATEGQEACRPELGDKRDFELWFWSGKTGARGAARALRGLFLVGGGCYEVFLPLLLAPSFWLPESSIMSLSIHSVALLRLSSIHSTHLAT